MGAIVHSIPVIQCTGDISSWEVSPLRLKSGLQFGQALCSHDVFSIALDYLFFFCTHVDIFFWRHISCLHLCHMLVLGGRRTCSSSFSNPLRCCVFRGIRLCLGSSRRILQTLVFQMCCLASYQDVSLNGCEQQATCSNNSKNNSGSSSGEGSGSGSSSSNGNRSNGRGSGGNDP